MFIIEVKDNGVQAVLNQVAGRVNNMKPVLQTIGEDVIARAKARFGTSTGPDGVRWKSNARSTLEALLERRSGSYAKFTNLKSKKEGFTRVGNKKGFYNQDGTLDSKSQVLLASKKPLIGASHSLASQFSVKSDGHSVTIGNSMIYAAIQQFGGSKSKFPKLWGDIPARPFLPIMQNGKLYPAERATIIDTLNAYLLP